MSRSVGVYITAVLVLAGSALCLMSGVFHLLMASFPIAATPTAATPTFPTQTVPFMKYAFYFVAALSFGFGAWGVATGIGLFGFRRWARISILIFSGLLLLFTVPGLVIFLLIPLPVPAEAPPAMMVAVRVVVAVFYGILIAIAAWWIYLFNKASVKQQFLGGLLAAGPSRRPLSITIIAWFLLIGAVTFPFLAIMRMPAFLFGFQMPTWSAPLIYLLYGVAQAYLGLGLLKLKPLTRTLAVYFFLFGIANGVAAFLFAVQMDQWLTQYLSQMPPPVQAQKVFYFALSRWCGLGLPIILMAIAIWFLVTRRNAFVPTEQQPSPPRKVEGSPISK